MKIKALVFFSFSDYKINLIEYSTKFKYIIPFKILGEIDFNLFAVWAMNCKENRYERYIAQVWLGINYFSNLLNDSTVIVGDFNSNRTWDCKDRLANHTDVVNYLSSKDIISLYHNKYNENQGKETKPTLYMYRKFDKPYHIDYCFASSKFVQEGYNFDVGNYNDWTQFSDHCPIIVEIEFNKKNQF